MITKENIKEVIESINNKDFLNVMNAEWDEVLITLDIFNGGFIANIETTESLNEEQRNEFINNGDLIIYKEDLISLVDSLAKN